MTETPIKKGKRQGDFGHFQSPAPGHPQSLRSASPQIRLSSHFSPLHPYPLHSSDPDHPPTATRGDRQATTATREDGDDRGSRTREALTRTRTAARGRRPRGRTAANDDSHTRGSGKGRPPHAGGDERRRSVFSLHLRIFSFVMLF